MFLKSFFFFLINLYAYTLIYEFTVKWSKWKKVDKWNLC